VTAETTPGRYARVIRQDVRSMHAYAIQDSAGLVKLDAMENPFRLPEALQRELGRRLGAVAINRYPARCVADVIAALAKYVDLPAGCKLMLAYGAGFELTPRAEGVKGAIAKANELAAGIADSWIPQQFENPANVEVHRRTTAQEILNDFRDSPIDVLITGVGTGGHITACAQVLISGDKGGSSGSTASSGGRP
jgi:hypothetical protein